MTKEERKIYRAAYYQKNKEKEKQKRRERYELNKEKTKVQNQKWYYKNKEYRTQKIKEYRENNIDKVKKWTKEYNKILLPKRKEKRQKDFVYKLKHSVSNLIRGAFKRANCRKTNRASEILGCTINEFKNHIENQFENWMNWNNYGNYRSCNSERRWCFDHIIPIDSAKTKEDVIRLNHYSNIRPMCSYENAVKYNKLIKS